MRFFDFILALIGIAFLIPLFLPIAILIKLDSEGPIIYSQERVGFKGKIFRLYKFRTMIIHAHQTGTSVTSSKDPRITKVWQFLRKTKLDELPQFWNVLKGDMSIVGPRPDVPEIVKNYTPEMKRIFDVLPGITSNASLSLCQEQELLSLANNPEQAYKEIFVPAKVKFALDHVDKKSFWFDISILMKTLWALTGGKIFTTKEHPMVKEIKEQILLHNRKEKI